MLVKKIKETVFSLKDKLSFAYNSGHFSPNDFTQTELFGSKSIVMYTHQQRQTGAGTWLSNKL